MHPPLLYMGYVGLAVPFAFAVAALLSGRLDQRWARWTRPWTTASWMFLTVGIALGSWWAYYELGWGGWWFWDPVENASFMPWLAGTALIHTLAVTERRGLFGNTTLLLAIAAFGLSLLGTFLVRSGVLVSVHAFASDPARGLFIILVFLAVVMGGALLLYAFRNAATSPRTGFKLVSRESALLVNTVLLSAATLLVLFGTLYPLALDALDMGKISVGPPYFNLVFILPMLPLLLVVGAGMHASWKATDTAAWGRKLRAPAAVAILAGIVLSVAAYGYAGVLTGVGILIAAWVIASALRDPMAWLLRRGPRPGRSSWGMQLAHCGLGVTTLGVVVVSAWGVEIDRSLALGESLEVSGYEFQLERIEDVQGPNYQAQQGVVRVTRDGGPITTLYPQKRVYEVQQSPMTEAGIDAGWRHDLFVALGRTAGRGRLERARAGQAAGALHLAGRADHGSGRFAGDLGSPLPNRRSPAGQQVNPGPATSPGNEGVPPSKTRPRIRWILLLPCAVLLMLVYFFGVSLGRDPSLVPSPLIGRPAPEFTLPTLLDPGAAISLQDVSEGPWMLNVWASWCAGCIVEHEFLMALGRVSAPLYGLNWKDGRGDAMEWLELRGNPYRAIGVDPDGRAGIDWGVYGAPETFLIDAEGIVQISACGPAGRQGFRGSVPAGAGGRGAMNRLPGREGGFLGTKASRLRGGRDALPPRAAVAAAVLMLMAASAGAVDTQPPLPTTEQQNLYRKLLEEVRCMVCQNQNLADSDAPLAKDMRRELRRMVEEGASEDDVKQFLLDRYGDFALYRPRLAANTLLLWIGPGLIVAAALGAIALVIRRRMQMPIPEDDQGGAT